MKKQLFILAVSLFFIFNINVFSECFPDCAKVAKPPIVYSVVQPYCHATCFYTVYYSECIINGKSYFLIDSIGGHSTNHPCCQGTAVNDPIVSGFILTEAGRLISLTGIGSSPFSVFTPSKCRKWVGTLGPVPVHNAVLVPCDFGISCCEFIYTIINGESTLTGTNTDGPNTCLPEEACMQICD